MVYCAVAFEKMSIYIYIYVCRGFACESPTDKNIDHGAVPLLHFIFFTL